MLSVHKKKGAHGKHVMWRREIHPQAAFTQNRSGVSDGAKRNDAWKTLLMMDRE